MAEVIHVLIEPVHLEGRTCRVQVVGRPAGNIWEGWIEFDCGAGEVLRTARETTQPDRNALEYWATGLSATYLEGALKRALQPSVSSPRPVVARPHFDEPAPAVVPPPPSEASAVLDPFSVAAKGSDLLRQELGALRAWHLRNIVRAYSLADDAVDLERLTEDQLADLIVRAVEAA